MVKLNSPAAGNCLDKDLGSTPLKMDASRINERKIMGVEMQYKRNCLLKRESSGLLVFSSSFSLVLWLGNIVQSVRVGIRGTGCFTGLAAKTTVKMLKGCFASRVGTVFQQLLDQVNASPGTIQLIASEQIGRTSGCAKTTVDAGP